MNCGGGKCTGSRAFMLLETMLAMAISALIAAAVLMMLTSTSQAADKGASLSMNAIELQAFSETLARDVRRSTAVLDQQEHSLTLWVHDADGDAQPAMNEIIYYSWDQPSGRMTRFTPLEGAGGQAAAVVEGPMTVPDQIGETHSPEVLASGVSNCLFGTSEAEATNRCIVSAHIKLEGSSLQATVIAVPRCTGE